MARHRHSQRRRHVTYNGDAGGRNRKNGGGNLSPAEVIVSPLVATGAILNPGEDQKPKSTHYGRMIVIGVVIILIIIIAIIASKTNSDSNTNTDLATSTREGTRPTTHPATTHAATESIPATTASGITVEWNNIISGTMYFTVAVTALHLIYFIVFYFEWL